MLDVILKHFESYPVEPSWMGLCPMLIGGLSRECSPRWFWFSGYPMRERVWLMSFAILEFEMNFSLKFHLAPLNYLFRCSPLGLIPNRVRHYAIAFADDHYADLAECLFASHFARPCDLHWISAQRHSVRRSGLVPRAIREMLVFKMTHNLLSNFKHSNYADECCSIALIRESEKFISQPNTRLIK